MSSFVARLSSRRLATSENVLMYSPRPLRSRANDAALVRVKCEAPDCHALLEVSVDPGHVSQHAAVVRCGGCRRLLEVDLDTSISPNVRREQFCPFPMSQQLNHTTETVSTGSHKAQKQELQHIHAKLPIVQSRSAKFVRNPSVPYLRSSRITFGNLTKPPPLMRHTSAELSTNVDFRQLPSSFLFSQLSSEHAPRKTESQKKTQRKSLKAGQGRQPSPYNQFVRQEMRRILAEDPSLKRKEAFKLAARNWARPYGRSKQSQSLQSTSPSGSQQTHVDKADLDWASATCLHEGTASASELIGASIEELAVPLPQVNSPPERANHSWDMDENHSEQRSVQY